MMKLRFFVFTFLLSGNLLATPDAVEDSSSRGGRIANPITLGEIERSILSHHPLVFASYQRVRRAEGNELSARGYFDPTVKAQGKITTLGYYELRTFDTELRQRTGLWGLEVYGGYRIGTRVDSAGPYPSYYSDQTLSGGEFRVGAELPIFRDGPIDAGRARHWAAAAATDAARVGVERAELELLLSGAKAYFRWVAAGQKWQVAEGTLELAEARAAQMSERTSLGLSSDFDRLDNERMVFERKERAIASRRDFEAASFELSLFLRSSDGKPRIPDASEVPSFSPESGAGQRPLDERALNERLEGCHPQLRQSRAELRAQEIELRLARNQLAPELKASAQVSRDIGDSTSYPSLGGTVLEAGIKLSMPLLLSNERGQADAKLASLEEKRAEIRFTEERIFALVKDVASRLRATHERRRQTEHLSVASRGLAKGERERLENGSSNLLFLNLRELAALDADSRLIDAQALEHEVLFEIHLLEKIRCDD